MKFTAKFFVGSILPEIVGDKPACDHYRGLVLDIDNSSPHRPVLTAQKLEENGIGASPHTAFSSHLVPLDPFLFAARMDQLARRIFEWLDRLVEETCEMTSVIP
jgi:hypothetical protein